MRRFALFLMSLLVAGAATAATSVAMVAGQAPRTIYIAWSQPSVAVADTLALKGCRDLARKIALKGAAGKCAVVARYTDLGAGALVCGTRECAWAYGQDSTQEAAQNAFKSCTTAGFAGCNDTDVLTWTENVGGGQPAARRAAPARQCSPPAGKVVRSQTRCNNGACTRTFENGCTVQFEAPYCHDPFSGQWSWKPDGC